MKLGHFHGARADGRTVRGCACLLSDHAIDRYWQTITLDASVRVFELVDRYHASADALRRCSERPAPLRIDRYGGDYASGP